MKQLLFLLACTLVGVGGAVSVGPFPAVAVYYLFAVLRPQYMWQWALPVELAWSQYAALAAMVGTVGVAFGLLPLTGRPAAPPRGVSPVVRVYVLLGLWLSVTYVTARDQELAYPWLTEYSKIFLMVLVASFAVRELRQAWVLYTLTSVALAYVAYEINLTYFLSGRIDVYHRGYGGLDNNGAGLMLAMGVPLAVYAWEATKPWYRWGFVAAVPLLLHAVLMTYSRGAMVSLLAVTPLLVLRSKRRWQFAGLALALAWLVPVLAGQEIRNRFFSVQDYQQDGSANSRFDSWRAAFQISLDYPVTGVGIRNSGLVVYDYGADMEGRTIHSQYLQLLADSGYPALLLYLTALGMVGVALLRTRRLLRGRSDDEAVRCFAMVAGLEASMAVFCVGSLFLSLEVFELPYLIGFLAGQLHLIVKATGVATAAQPANPVPVPPTRHAAALSPPGARTW